MHGHSMVSVYKCIDMTLLPDEYLPDDIEEETVGTLEDVTGATLIGICIVNI